MQRITIECEPDGSFVRTIEVESDGETVYIYNRLTEDGMSHPLHVMGIPVEHSAVIARAIFRAAGVVA
jgi:hypothetical protein